MDSPTEVNGTSHTFQVMQVLKGFAGLGHWPVEVLPPTSVVAEWDP